MKIKPVGNKKEEKKPELKSRKNPPDGLPSYEEVFAIGYPVKAEDFGGLTHSNNWCLYRLGDVVARQGSWDYSMYKVKNGTLVEVHNSHWRADR